MTPRQELSFGMIFLRSSSVTFNLIPRGMLLFYIRLMLYSLRHAEWSYTDLNRGPCSCHARALPAELPPRGRPAPPGVGPGGLGQQFIAGLVRAYVIPTRVVRLVLGVHTVELSIGMHVHP